MTDDSIIDLARQHQAQGGFPHPGDTQESAIENTSQIKRAAQMSENIPVDKNIQETLDSLLKNVRDKMNWVAIELPSKGVLYENGTSEIKIRPFTYRDEKELKSVQSASDPEKTIESLLRNCIDGIRVEELTPIDRLYVLFRIRGISYGDDYSIGHKCVSCGSDSSLTLKISTLKTTPLDMTDMRFMLPDSEQEAEIRYPKVQDEHLYSNPDKLMDNMHRFVKSVGGVNDPLIIEQFVKSTTVRDIDILRTKIFSPAYGMESEFFYSCASCGKRNQVDINLNSNFFTAS